MKEGLPMEISTDVKEIREKSAESIVVGDTSHRNMEVSRIDEGRNQKRERGNINCKMKGVPEIRVEIFLAHARRPIRKMEERA
jgi:hypothetical protein